MDKKYIKSFTSAIELKEGGEPGEFRAVFSRFNVIDRDGDVTVPIAFVDGQKVRISHWGHRWQDLPVGRGEIHFDDEIAWLDGKFFLDTQVGNETYKTVKNLGELQEWSYGFDILESEAGQFEGEEVRYLRSMIVHEVSPVMLGTGIGTMTTAIKSGGEVEGESEDQELPDTEPDAHDETENTDECEAGDDAGKQSGVHPENYLTLIQILELED